MIATTTKQSGKAKKEEWSIYHNIGVLHDAERFSLIDSVIDEEYNFDDNNKTKTGVPKPNLMARFQRTLKSKLSNNIYRTYLFCWFSLYCGISLIGKLVR